MLQVNPMFSGGTIDGIGFIAGSGFQRTRADDHNLPSGAQVGDIAVAYETGIYVGSNLDEQAISWTSAVSGTEGAINVRVFYKKLVSDDLSVPIPRKMLRVDTGEAGSGTYRGCILFRAADYTPAHFDGVFAAISDTTVSLEVPARAFAGWRIGCGASVFSGSVTGFTNSGSQTLSAGRTDQIITVAPILESETGTFSIGPQSGSSVMFLGGFNLELTL